VSDRTAVAATVRDHDPATGAGSLLLDDGSVLDYSAAAFAAGGLRFLRSGQRVQVLRDAGGSPVVVGL
jgi:hypothetical protein